MVRGSEDETEIVPGMDRDVVRDPAEGGFPVPPMDAPHYHGGPARATTINTPPEEVTSGTH